MCLLLGAMCPKTKTKSRTSTKKSSKKHECHGYTTRKTTKEELWQTYLPPMPMPMMNQHQPGYNYGHGYGYEDWAAWVDNYPATISTKQWREHMQTAQNAYNSAQENEKRIGEVKSAITSDVKEAQTAIEETHASVKNTETRVKDTRDAIGMAHDSIKSTHAAVKEAQLAIQKTQDAINDKHAEHLSKQEACAADVARVRQLLEEDAKKREETRRVEEMVRYAQSQGLLQTQVQAQPDPDRDYGGRSSQSSSPMISASPSRAHDHIRYTSVDEERKMGKRQQLDYEREELERQHEISYLKAAQDLAHARLRLQEEQERWSRTEGELACRDTYLHHPRLQSAYPDNAIETPPYNAYSYAAYAIRGGGVGHRSACGQLARRGQPRRGNGRPWDYHGY
ncbi:hypothetical protein F4823DRAFT_571833 [Ustulina deusta]|nr:hypothetical protein F4823DRAFT_571833 [Ustulina deusta]